MKKIKLNRKILTSTTLLIQFIFYICSGVALLLYPVAVIGILGVLIVGIGYFFMLSEILVGFGKGRRIDIVKALIPGVFSTILLFNMQLFVTLYALILGLYILLIAIINLIDFLILYHNKANNRYRVLIKGVFFFIFGLSFVLTPSNDLLRAINITGIFLILYGITLLNDLIIESLKLQRADKIKSRVRINVPVIFTALLPKFSIDYINDLLKKDNTNIIDNTTTSQDVNFEILVHVTNEGTGTMGHVDLYFDGKIYCYGNYDFESYKLFSSVGDGVLFTCNNKQQYIEFCSKTTKDSIFAFGLALNDEQMQRVRNELDSIFKHLREWKSLKEKDINGEYNDYASMLYENTKAKMYKFNDTNYKTYFVLTTNCVKLADQVVRSIGISATNPNGIITPGSYYDYFDNQYRLENSIVITKENYVYQSEKEDK